MWLGIYVKSSISLIILVEAIRFNFGVLSCCLKDPLSIWIVPSRVLVRSKRALVCFFISVVLFSVNGWYR